MISVCTTILDSIDRFLPIYFESLETRTKLVDEVILSKMDAPIGENKTWERNGIVFKQFGGLDGDRKQQGTEHGLGLHFAMDNAKNDHVLFMDPDVFFYRPVDEIFYNLMQKYNLDVIGTSHSAAMSKAQTYFPCVYCLLLKKSSMPGPDFLKGLIVDENGTCYDGKILTRIETRIVGNREPVPGLAEFVKQYPNPQGDYDTGAWLWFWAHQNNWKWLSFQTIDINTYQAAFNRGNIKIEEKYNRKDNLLYHCTSSTVLDPSQPDGFEGFKLAWEKSLEN